jgi:hypothetical protein
MSDDMFDTEDPFAGDGFGKALSFKRVKEGHTYKVKVLKRPTLRQATDFTSKKPKTWPDGNPVMTVVIAVEDEEGEKKSVWAQKPSSMFRALKDAQEEAGAKIEPGDTLEITWVRSEPNKKNPDLNDSKIYEAKLIKADALSD